MERLNRRELVGQLRAGITTTPSSSALSVRTSELWRWRDLLKQMAVDKRQDLAPGILSYWELKLSDYSDREIYQALLAYSGDFFPSVDHIIGLIIERDHTNRSREELDATERYLADMHKAWAMSPEEAAEYDKSVQEVKRRWQKALSPADLRVV